MFSFHNAYVMTYCNLGITYTLRVWGTRYLGYLSHRIKMKQEHTFQRETMARMRCKMFWSFRRN